MPTSSKTKYHFHPFFSACKELSVPGIAVMKFTTTLLALLTITLGNASPVGHPKRGYCADGCCGVEGFESRYASACYVTEDPYYCSEEACGQLCIEYEGCQTYAIGRGSCRLYSQSQ